MTTRARPGPAPSVERNTEGAWVITAEVTDGNATWYHHERLYGYSRHDALTLFRQSVERQGWRRV